MTSTVSINIERTGFPVKVGSVELWFDCSIENLRRYIDVNEIASEKIKEAQEKAKHIHFPKGMDVSDVDTSKVDEAIDVHKEFVAAIYDIWFGDGAFKLVYAEYRDIVALESAIDPLGEAIGARITEFEEEQTAKAIAKKDKYTQKKSAKQK